MVVLKELGFIVRAERRRPQPLDRNSKRFPIEQRFINVRDDAVCLASEVGIEQTARCNGSRVHRRMWPADAELHGWVQLAYALSDKAHCSPIHRIAAEKHQAIL